MIVRATAIIFSACAVNAFAPSFNHRPTVALFDGNDDLEFSSTEKLSDDSKDLEGMAVVNGEVDSEEESPKAEYLQDMAMADVAPSDVSDDDAAESPDIASTPLEPVNDTIAALLKIAASTGRGEFATASQKDQAAELIASMELQNPTPEPTNSPLINGRWELLYSSTQLFRSSPFFMAGRAVCSTPDQAKQYDWFCDMHRKALAISSIGQVRQVVSDTRIVSEFEVQVGAVPFLSDFTPFAYSGGWPVTIEGAIVSSADITPSNNGAAWELYMDTVEIKGSNIPGVRQVLDQGLKLGSRTLGDFLESNIDSYTNPKPVFETTFLSDTLRISRDQDGKVFVYGKMSDDTEPSDYSGVDADLGALKLLEGFNDAITKFYL